MHFPYLGLLKLLLPDSGESLWSGQCLSPLLISSLDLPLVLLRPLQQLTKETPIPGDIKNTVSANNTLLSGGLYCSLLREKIFMKFMYQSVVYGHGQLICASNGLTLEASHHFLCIHFLLYPHNLLYICSPYHTWAAIITHIIWPSIGKLWLLAEVISPYNQLAMYNMILYNHYFRYIFWSLADDCILTISYMAVSCFLSSLSSLTCSSRGRSWEGPSLTEPVSSREERLVLETADISVSLIFLEIDDRETVIPCDSGSGS